VNDGHDPEIARWPEENPKEQTDREDRREHRKSELCAMK
jgi:hypothetical protein